MNSTIRILMLFAYVLVTSDSYTQENEGKIVIEITKEINGEKKTFKGEYNSREEMEADPNYQEFAGKSSSFQFWSGDDADMFLQLDQLKDLKKHFQHQDDDGANAFFFHGFSEDSTGNGFDFHFDSFDSQDFTEEFSQKMKDLGVEMEALAQKFSDDGGHQIKIITMKRVKVTEVGSEFGKAGKVDDKDLLELQDLTFYPNPSRDGRIKVQFTAPQEGELAIKVSNLNGKQVFSRYFERFSGLYAESIDLSKQNEGVYLLEIAQGKKRITKKIVIE